MISSACGNRKSFVSSFDRRVEANHYLMPSVQHVARPTRAVMHVSSKRDAIVALLLARRPLVETSCELRTITRQCHRDEWKANDGGQRPERDGRQRTPQRKVRAVVHVERRHHQHVRDAHERHVKWHPPPAMTATRPARTCTATVARNHGSREGMGMPPTVMPWSPIIDAGSARETAQNNAAHETTVHGILLTSAPHCDAPAQTARKSAVTNDLAVTRRSLPSSISRGDEATRTR